MLGIISGVFLVLHGLVHLLYFGQSARLFELQSGMVWPEGSWMFAKSLGDDRTRLIANVSCLLAATGFVAGGIGILVKQAWWHPVVIGSSVFSAVLILLFWDGIMQKLADKGGIGLLINLQILVALLVFQWPSLGI